MERTARLAKTSVSSGRQQAVLCARIADDIKGDDIVILDLRRVSYITDFFVIATAQNPRQMLAIAQEIMTQMKKLGVRLLGAEGLQYGHWILLDYADFVVHVFEPQYRKVYDLDLVWGDAKKIEWRVAAVKPRSVKPSARS